MRTTTTRTTTPVKELDWWRTLNTGSSETSREGGSSCRVDYPLLIIQTHYWLPVPGRNPSPHRGSSTRAPKRELGWNSFFLGRIWRWYTPTKLDSFSSAPGLFFAFIMQGYVWAQMNWTWAPQPIFIPSNVCKYTPTVKVREDLKPKSARGWKIRYELMNTCWLLVCFCFWYMC